MKTLNDLSGRGWRRSGKFLKRIGEISAVREQAWQKWNLNSSWIGLWYLPSKWGEYHDRCLKIMVKVWGKTLEIHLAGNNFHLYLWAWTLKVTSFTIVHIMVRCFREDHEETESISSSPDLKQMVLHVTSDHMRISLWFFVSQVIWQVCAVCEERTSSVAPVACGWAVTGLAGKRSLSSSYCAGKDPHPLCSGGPRASRGWGGPGGCRVFLNNPVSSLPLR